ncbi:CE1759 family FMN reductase [Amnibacterium setariae]|uniref:NADH-dependent FMN reductase n=1 Tax=Amnibacterium setariae TaxID=2306585 RepID=A0A3A1U2Y3_9MICO|nr:CE1759 family FMN reductase [Amnibacterium setariae]RIX30660.1 NADH-dependent FMN reductase [Amnibacterium setariae]
MNLVVVSGGTSDPSSTRMLADRITARVLDRAAASGLELTTAVIELRPLAAELASAQVTGFAPPAVAAAIATLAEADALIVATPVYKAGVSGLVKSFFDVVDQDLLIAVPTVLAATAGTARHALVADEQLRSLFAYLRALTVPTSVFAAGEDWGGSGLQDRVDRAAHELVVLLAADVRSAMRDAGTRYNRVFGGAAEGADEVEFDSDLMRLATGGSAVAPPVRPV